MVFSFNQSVPILFKFRYNAFNPKSPLIFIYLKIERVPGCPLLVYCCLLLPFFKARYKTVMKKAFYFQSNRYSFIEGFIFAKIVSLSLKPNIYAKTIIAKFINASESAGIIGSILSLGNPFHTRPIDKRKTFRWKKLFPTLLPNTAAAHRTAEYEITFRHFDFVSAVTAADPDNRPFSVSFVRRIQGCQLAFSSACNILLFWFIS